MTAEEHKPRQIDAKQALADIEASSRRPLTELTEGEQLDRMLGRTRYRRMLVALVLSIVIYTPYCFIVGQLVTNGYAAFLAYLGGAYLIVLACFLYIDLPRGSRAFTYVITITFVFFLLYALSLPSRGPRDKSKEAEVKQNLFAIQLALKNYALDHEGQYPSEIDADFLAPYASRYGPCNPFTEDRRIMRPVPLGEPEPWGDFTYIPIEMDGEISSYKLYAYGDEHSRGKDIDGDGEGDYVILVLGPAGEEKGPRQKNEAY
jgi:hypothetical protein